MELKLYQIVIAVIALFMVYQGGKNYFCKQSGQTFLKFFVRLLVWGGMASVVLFPSLTNLAAKVIGIEDNVNAVILTGFILVFLMIFKLLSAIERLEQQLTSLTRKEALEEISDKNQ